MPTKEDTAAKERAEALRVDKQSTGITAHTTYISPDLSFTEGHGEDPFPEEEAVGPEAARKPEEAEPKTREENIAEREEEVESAVAAEKEEAERQAKISEEEAEAYAESVKTTQALQTAISGLVSTASKPVSQPKKESGTSS